MRAAQATGLMTIGGHLKKGTTKYNKTATEVLVVGAGPVGLGAALLLSERGIPFQLLDRECRSGEHDYPLALHPATLRILSELGLLDEIMENGRRIDTVELYDGTIRRAEINLSRLTAEFPFLIALPQSFLEGIFEQKLRNQGVEISWNRSVVDLHCGESGVRAAVDKLETVSGGYGVATYERVCSGKVEIEAKFVIGADGYHSSVRRLLDIPFDEIAQAELFAIIEFASDLDLGGQARITLDGKQRNVVWPLSGGRICGVFQLDPSEIKETQTLARVPQTLEIGTMTYTELPESLAVGWVRRGAPTFSDRRIDIAGSTVVRFERCLARSFGRNTIWLCGDAAHATGPIGAHSVNAGFLEAYDLVSRISQVRAGRPNELLQRYGDEHLARWQQILTGTQAMYCGMETNPWVLAHRKSLLEDLPGTGAELTQLLSQLDLRIMDLNDKLPTQVA